MRNTLLLLCFLSFTASNAQVYLEPYTGYAIDVRPKQNLHSFNTGIQITFSKKPNYGFSAGVINGFGIKRKGEDSSFTSNPSLPIYAKAPKTIQTGFTGIYINNRFRLIKIGEKHSVHLNFQMGLRLQKLVVTYSLNSSDYVVLNPGANAERLAVYAGSGFEYLYTLKKGRVFFQTNVITPSLRRKREQPDRLNLPVPLSFNAGYSFELKKKTVQPQKK